MRTQNCLIISTESQPQLSGKGAKRKSRLQRMNSSHQWLRSRKRERICINLICTLELKVGVIFSSKKFWEQFDPIGPVQLFG